MARTITEIEASIVQRLKASFTLSTSAAAEWRMWTHCMAYCIHVFEVTLDLFKDEMDADVEREIAGSQTWYNEKCYEFQMGHELVFSDVTGKLGYEKDDAESRVVKIACVDVSEDGTLYFRVATMDEDGKIVPLTSNQMLNFKNYIDAIKFAGTKTQVISTDADLVRYQLTAWYNPATPVDTVREAVMEALDEFRISRRFGGVIYRHEMLDAVTAVDSVVTAKIVSLYRKGTDDDEWQEIDTVSHLHAGYFDYEPEDCELELLSINDLQ